MKETFNSKKYNFTKRKKIRIVRVKDNTTFTVTGYKQASELTNISIERIQYSLNYDKITNGYKFYDW